MMCPEIKLYPWDMLSSVQDMSFRTRPGRFDGFSSISPSFLVGLERGYLLLLLALERLSTEPVDKFVDEMEMNA
jgi:hypothetical protein